MMNLTITKQIEKEIKNIKIDIAIYNIEAYEWGEPIKEYEKYNRLNITINNNVFSVILSEMNGNYHLEYCEKLNEILGNDKETFCKFDVFTGFWMKCNDKINNEIIDNIKQLTLKYYLISKYDKKSYERRGFNIYKYLKSWEE